MLKQTLCSKTSLYSMSNNESISNPARSLQVVGMKPISDKKTKQWWSYWKVMRNTLFANNFLLFCYNMSNAESFRHSDR